MKKTKLISHLLCTALFIQSISGAAVTVFATEEAIGAIITTDTISSSFSEETKEEMYSDAVENSRENNLNSEITSISDSVKVIEESSDTTESSVSEEQPSHFVVEGKYGSVLWNLTKEGILTLGEGMLPDVEKEQQNQSPWVDFSDIIHTINLTGKITATAYGAESLFSGLTNLKQINHLNQIDLSNARSIRHLFSQTNLQHLNLQNWDVSRVEDFSFIFKGLNLKELNLSNWRTSKETNWKSIFEDVKVNQLNISGWGISESDWEEILTPEVTIEKVIGLNLVEENPSEKEDLVDTLKEIDEIETLEKQVDDESAALNLYGSIINKNYQLFSDRELKHDISNQHSLINTTIHIKESFVTEEKETYYSISDNKKWLGYIHEKHVRISPGDQGTHQNYGKYVSITGSYNIWNGFNWEMSVPGSQYKNETLQARGIYHHFNGSRYLSLYDNKGKWLGYINELGTTLGNGDQGVHQNYGKYVSIKGNYDIWDSFDWKKNKSGISYKNETFQARGVYHHFNGSRYLSLYDNKGQWLGYINELGTTLGNGDQGAHQSYGKYVNIKGGYNIWDSFDWKRSTPGSNYKNQTLQAKGIYHHFNGSRYLSLYDSKGKWLGYINESGVTVALGAQGTHQSYGKYVNIKGNYAIWDSFSWKNQTSGSQYKNQTLQAKGIYHHFNGSRYLSLYDGKGKWLGYMNEAGATVAKAAQGSHNSYNQLVKISAKNPTIWKNFSFKDKVSGNHKNKMYLAKGYYNHFNGSRYLSLYNNGKWVGYINENSTTKARTAGSYLQTSREKVVATLNKNRNIYLKTPYKSVATAPYHPERLMSPIGRPNGNSPAFNCTGFVGTTIRDAGGNLSKITSVANAWGGINNAYNWRDTLLPRTDSISFDNVNDLLKSGLAQKGDIIYLEADFSKPNYDCHIGFFWGDTPSQDKFWHSSTVGGGNNITNIKANTFYSKVVLIPMG